MSDDKASDFQGRSSKSGDLFAKSCVLHLESLGFRILYEKWSIKEAGIEIDCVALNRRGKKIFFECKGGYEGDRPGLVRTDTTKKMLANAFLLHHCGLSPLVIMTSAKPKEETASDKMIRLATAKVCGVIFDIIELGDARDRKRLKALLDMDDFSTPRLPLPLDEPKPTGSAGMSLRPLDEAVQMAWHPDPKLLDQGRKKRKRGPASKQNSATPVKKRKRHEEGLPLFEKE